MRMNSAPRWSSRAGFLGEIQAYPPGVPSNSACSSLGYSTFCPPLRPRLGGDDFSGFCTLRKAVNHLCIGSDASARD